jgi:hypothetical protein
MKEIDTLVVIGDSYSWGTGLKDAIERTNGLASVKLLYTEYENWPYNLRNNFGGLLCKEHRLDYLNLAQPGCSNETIFRKAMKFVSVDYKKFGIDLDKTLIFIGWTGPHRREFYAQDRFLNGYWNMSPQWALKNGPKWAQNFVDAYANYMFSDYHDSAREFVFQVAMQNTLENKGILFRQMRALYAGTAHIFHSSLDSSEIDRSTFLHYDTLEHNISFFAKPHEADVNCQDHPNELGHRLIFNHLNKNIFLNE